MPFAFLIVGTVFVIAGVRGTSQDLLTLLKGDITGTHNFVYWFVSILILGSLGYVQDLRPLSRSFLVLVLVVLVLANGKNGGLFTKFNSALKQMSSSNGASSTPVIP